MMIISLLISLTGFILHTGDIPNHYDTFLQAKQAAAKSQQPMVIFITDDQCSRCASAWQTFAKDPGAVAKYVSVTVNQRHFDGGVIADMYEIGDAPAWVIVDAKGAMTDKWNGGWKDANGIPMATEEDKRPVAQSQIISRAPEKSNPAISSTKETSATEKPSKQQTEPAPVKPAVASGTPSAGKEGYVLQAGYFGSEANAKNCINQLTGNGWEGFTAKPSMQNGSTYYRVISQTFETEQAAQTFANQMTAKGAKVALKRTSEI